MKIVYIGIFRQPTSQQSADPVQSIKLASVEDLSSFGYFTRSTVSQHLTFGARTTTSRTPLGQRASIVLESDFPFLCHVYVRQDGLAGIVVSDKEYPPRVAFTLLSKVLSAYEQQMGVNWKTITEDQNPSADKIQFMTDDLALYQNPKEADKLLAVQSQLDSIKDVMQTNIEQMMQRGETLDSLMGKSEDLNTASVAFYKQAKKANSCCKYY
jgi:synaptobrevin family protein YKT6